MASEAGSNNTLSPNGTGGATSRRGAADLSERRKSVLVEHSSEMMLVVSPEGSIQVATGAVEAVLGDDSAEVVGTSILELVHPRDRRLMSGLMKRVSESENGASERSGWRMRRAPGTWVDVEVVATNLINELQIGGVLLNCRDISASKAFEEQLRHRAFHDPLTHLPNRALLLDRVEQALARENRPLGLLFVDIDDFKVVNDSLGHAAGDALLSGVARRLRGCLRSADTAARLGGDEFALLIVEMAAEHECERVASRVLDTLRRPFNLHGESVHITVSVGYVTAVSGSVTVDELLRRADFAMYAAKRRGKARAEAFDPVVAAEFAETFESTAPMNEEAERTTWLARAEGQRAEIEEVLSDPQRHIQQVFQPIVDLRSGLVSAYEALSRFKDTARPPNAWFAQAHRCGLGIELELAAARAQLQAPCRPPGTRLSINLSPSALQSSELELLLREHDLSMVTLELTEDELITEGSALEDRLDELRLRGAHLAVDDLGAGYAGLRQVMRLQPDVLKLDRSLVSGVSADPAKAPMVDALVRYARRIGAVVCAEGIETMEDLEALADLDVTLGQGFALARPGEPWADVDPRAARLCTSALWSVIRGESSGNSSTRSTDAELEELCQLISRVTDRDSLRAVLEPTRRLLQADQAAISILDEEGTSLQAVLVDGGALDDETYLLADYPATAKAMASGEAVQVLASDVAADPSELRMMAELGYRSMLMVPLLAGGQSMGVLELFSIRERPWTRAQIRCARILGYQMASVLRNARHSPLVA
jgi:diguanylate cyclase (GGDEF)-like protein/PAS domain S-box-containing protein